MLHVYDPKAMHSIYVKDQDNYSRGEKAMRLVQYPSSHLAEILTFG